MTSFIFRERFLKTVDLGISKINFKAHTHVLITILCPNIARISNFLLEIALDYFL